MGKFDLGVSTTKVTGIDPNNMLVNDSEIKNCEKNIEKQLDDIRLSLINISNLLNQSVNKKYVKGSRIQIFKGWARKAKAQSLASEKLKKEFADNYKNDLQDYTLLILDNHINDLKQEINSIRGEVDA